MSAAAICWTRLHIENHTNCTACILSFRSADNMDGVNKAVKKTLMVIFCVLILMLPIYLCLVPTFLPHLSRFNRQVGEEVPYQMHEETFFAALAESQHHPTMYTMNFWYMYAKYIAEIHNRSDCYVSTYMPIATNTPHVVPRPFPNLADLFPDILVSKQNCVQKYWFLSPSSSSQHREEFFKI